MNSRTKMDIGTNGDAKDEVRDASPPQQQNNIISVPDIEKSAAMYKCLSIADPQKFIDEMKTAIQCWAGMKVIRYHLVLNFVIIFLYYVRFKHFSHTKRILLKYITNWK